MNYQNTAADILLILSPADRMFYTYSIPAAEKSFNVATREPIFVFGSQIGTQQPTRIDSLEKALEHLDIQPAGLFYIPPSTINLELFKTACLERKALTTTNNGFTFTKNGIQYNFSTIDSMTNSTTPQKTQGISKA